MDCSIEVATLPETNTTAKGRVLENLTKKLLDAQQYEVTKEVRLTGMEIDLYAKHKVNSARVFVECKAHESTLSAEAISKLVGDVTIQGFDYGWLVSTGPLSKDAEGLRLKIEDENSKNGGKFSIYTAQRIIQALSATNQIVSPVSIETMAAGEYVVNDNFVLLLTDIGQYWIIPVSETELNKEVSAVAYNATNGEKVTEPSAIEQLRKRSKSFQSIPWITSNEIAKASNTKTRISEYESVVPVISGDNWADYRPARPEDFVGRKNLLDDVFHFFDNVVDGTISTRLFSLKAPSGMGKSSAIIKLRALSRNIRRKNKYFVYAVDVRTAISPRYVDIAFKDCLNKAFAEGFIDLPVQQIEYVGMNQLFSSSFIQELFDYLEEQQKVIVLVFDQFEELFSKKELFELFSNVKSLSNFIDSQQRNFVLGFAWKTDLTIPLEHPAYHLWSSLEDRRREFELSQFSSSDIKASLNHFGKQLGEKVNPILKSYLAKQCQGYPWLLKKLSIHVYELLNSGVSQETVIGQKLNIVDLFEHDLTALAADEHACVRDIAKDTPADNHRLVDIYGDKIVSSLVNKRLVIRRASKLTLYWDIFRDYVLTKSIPDITSDYIPQYPTSTIANALLILSNGDGSMQASSFQSIIGYKSSTIDNLMIDLVMFGIARKKDGIIYLNSVNESDIIDSLVHFFQKHSIYIELTKQYNGEFTYTDYFDLFDHVHSSNSVKAKTRQTYASKLLNWLLNLGLVTVKSGLYSLSAVPKKLTFSDIGANTTTRRGGKRKIGEFWGLSSPKKMIEAYEIISKEQSSYSELRKAGYRNAMELLLATGGCRRDGDNIVTVKSLDEVLIFIERSSTIKCTQLVMGSNPSAKGLEVGERLNLEFNRNWLDSSKLRYGNALIQWTKFIQSRK